MLVNTVAGLPRLQQHSLLPLLKIKAMTRSLCPRCFSSGPPRAVHIWWPGAEAFRRWLASKAN